jgi:exodeoxyribonuclease VII large subunit
VATALTGAAVHDIVTTVRGRLPGMRLIVRPVRVQGRGAGEEIVAALADLNQISEIDVIIVGRGGGSLEDLWAFNEELVVRAVAGSRAPVVSAVGHEIDVTLTDLAADCRAATPTAAGTLVVPNRHELSDRLARVSVRLARAVRVRLEREREQVAALARLVRHPQQQLRAQRLRVDELAERATRALDGAIRMARERWQGRVERLEALSPLAVLKRGYAIAQGDDDGRVIRSVREVAMGEVLKLTFGHGWARARVEEKHE